MAGLELPTPTTDGSHLAKLHSSPPLQLLTLAAMEAATRLDPGGFQALLRIEDRQPDRQADGYRRLWRRWLQTANLLQFLPGFEWVSAEAIDSQPQAPPPNIPTSSAKPETDDRLAELLPFCDPCCHDLLRAVLGKGCPVPEIGFELQDDSGRVCAEAELAWPDRLQAVVLPDREAAAQIFRDRGWRVFTPDTAAENITC